MPARAAAVYSTVCWQDTAVRHQSAFRDVRDVVDIREIGKGWWCCSFPLTFPWQQKQHRGVFPSQAGKALLLFQKHPKWVTQGRADSSLQLLLQLCVCPYTLCCVCLALSWTSVLHTHRQRNDTPENETGRERGSCREATLTKKKRKKSQPFCDSSIYMQDFCCRTKWFQILRFWRLLFSKETPCCCQTTTLFP